MGLADENIVHAVASKLGYSANEVNTVVEHYLQAEQEDYSAKAETEAAERKAKADAENAEKAAKARADADAKAKAQATKKG